MSELRVHLDTDFLIHAVGRSGPERRRLLELLELDVPVAMSAVAWYEFARGPRTVEQLAAARSFLREVVALDEEVALLAGELFRRLESPRRRAADLAIGVTASLVGATLLTRNSRAFEDVPGLELEVVSD